MNNFKSPNTFVDKNDSGAFVVLAALVMTVLLVFIAIAIDSSRFLTSMSEKMGTADGVALAALDAYLNTDPVPVPPTTLAIHNAKWLEAQKKIVEYVNLNKMTFVGGAPITLTDINAPKSGVSAIPGRWWINKPAICTAALACPCGGATGPMGPLLRPCFQPCSPADQGCTNPDGSKNTVTGDIFANAIQLTLTTEGQGGIISYFGQLAGISKVDVAGTSLATSAGSISHTLPQVGVLLFDLSRTTTIDNYLPFERNPAPAPATLPFASKREYSFNLSSNPGVCAAGSPNTCAVGSCALISDPTLQTEYNSYLPAAQGNYKCYSGSQNGVPEFNLVATGAGAPPSQPYATLLTALNRYLAEYKISGRSGDLISLIGFDNQDSPERHYPVAFPGSPTGYFVQPIDPLIDTMVTMTSSPDEAAKRNFFPRAGSRLNLSRALKAAADQILTAYPTTKIDPYIVLFTNGLSLCMDSPTPNICRGMNNTNPALKGLKDDLDSQILSLDQALSLVGESYLKPNNIKVHVITGDVGLPSGWSTVPSHTNLLWDGKKCLTDDESRRYRYYGVLPRNLASGAIPSTNAQLRTDFANIGVDPGDQTKSKYYQPMLYLYSLSAITQGDWLPIRPTCTFSTATAQSLCTTKSPPKRRTVASPPPTLANRTKWTLEAAYRAAAPPAVPPVTRDQIDIDGRLMCEPNGPGAGIVNLVNTLVTKGTQSRTIVLVSPD